VTAIPPRGIAGLPILETLGESALGAVYKARDDRFDREVRIIKVKRSQLPSAERLALEIRAVARLEHPNIARVYELFEGEGGISSLSRSTSRE
jgi:serine/threonine protein kinase